MIRKTTTWAAVAAAGFLGATTLAAEDAPLKTQKEKVSYGIGVMVANDFQQQDFDLDVECLIRGIRDSMTGKKLVLTDAEIKAALAAFETEMKQKMAKAQLEMAEKDKVLAEQNKKDGEAFLAENKKKPGVVALPSGLQYKILKAGTGKKPTAADTVECHYRGTLLDGTEFDSSYSRGKPATFPVRGVIAGWTEALQLMPVGSKWQLFVPANLAYGPERQGPQIGPNSTLVFEVELLGVK